MPESTQEPGDYLGNRADDPTPNVIDLVKAEAKRQDDLRIAAGEFTSLQSSCAKEIADLRAVYDDKLRKAESERLDAVRQADESNRRQQAEAADRQAAVLADRVAATATAAAAAVEQARIQTAEGLEAALAPIKADVSDLRRVQYEQQGQKSAGSDPILAAIAELRSAQSEERGQRVAIAEKKTTGQFNLSQLLVAVGILVALLVGTGYIVFGHSSTTATPVVCTVTGTTTTCK